MVAGAPLTTGIRPPISPFVSTIPEVPAGGRIIPLAVHPIPLVTRSSPWTPPATSYALKDPLETMRKILSGPEITAGWQQGSWYSTLGSATTPEVAR